VEDELGAVSGATLPGMPFAREVHRGTGERQVLEEADVGAGCAAVGHRRRVLISRSGSV
jgi:hypothetical protein